MSHYTTERLAKLTAVYEAATPGPWKRCPPAHRRGFTFGENEIVNRDGVKVVAWSGFDGADGTKKQRRADARFIAACRTEMPALVDGLQEARTALEPFARFAEAFDISAGIHWEDDFPLFGQQRADGSRVDVTIGDMRAARAYLKGEQP
jgi:hypothetical protein